LPKHFEFDQFYRFASALPAQHVDAYHSLDVRFGWSYNTRFSVAVVGQNLLRPYHYEWGTGDPSQAPFGVRRAIYAQLTWRQ